MKMLKRVRELSPKKKRVLIWTILVMAGFFLFKNYINNLQNKMRTIKNKNSSESSQIKEGLSEVTKKTEGQFKDIEKAIQEFMEKVKEKENQKNEAENKSQ